MRCKKTKCYRRFTVHFYSIFAFGDLSVCHKGKKGNKPHNKGYDTYSNTQDRKDFTFFTRFLNLEKSHNAYKSRYETCKAEKGEEE